MSTLDSHLINFYINAIKKPKIKIEINEISVPNDLLLPKFPNFHRKTGEKNTNEKRPDFPLPVRDLFPNKLRPESDETKAESRGVPGHLSPATFNFDSSYLRRQVLGFRGPFVIVWKRGTTLVSAGQQLISMDPRISLIGYNLQLKDIRHADQGDYTCQIGDGSQGDLIHTIEILSK
ncbi:unnamed protein product [Phyllotreta striolata]|uniref:Ig-like domain-containing protein n=1 Tax=Phyllotreta striolata TaxID=444603 RepID=A0A9N9XP57_PHYSR|nr:unnamed protein product [Phyllotreta striolata]